VRREEGPRSPDLDGFEGFGTGGGGPDP
jgi:hypothetical protein